MGSGEGALSWSTSWRAVEVDAGQPGATSMFILRFDDFTFFSTKSEMSINIFLSDSDDFEWNTVVNAIISLCAVISLFSESEQVKISPTNCKK